MITTEMTFDKENWTGEQVTIDVLAAHWGFEFELNGCKVEIKNRKWYADFVVYGIWVDGNETYYKVRKFEKDQHWEAVDHFGEWEWSRYGANPAEAATKLLCNLL